MTTLQTFGAGFGAGAGDSAAALHDSMATAGGHMLGDSLGFLLQMPTGMAHMTDAILPRDTLAVTAPEMFGPHSVRVLSEQGVIMGSDTLLAGGLVFTIAALVCFALYCFAIYYYSQQALAVVSVFRSKLYVDNILGQHNYTFDNFLGIAILLGLMTSGLAVIKVVELTAGPTVPDVVPGWITVPLTLWVWCTFGAVILYQLAVLGAAGWLTGSRKFMARLNYLRKINFSLFSIALTPLLLMFSLAGGHGVETLTVLLCSGLGSIVIFHLVRTYMLFVDEKISKLYWFLYLCGVEIFPVTLLVFTLVKYLR